MTSAALHHLVLDSRCESAASGPDSGFQSDPWHPLLRRLPAAAPGEKASVVLRSTPCNAPHAELPRALDGAVQPCTFFHETVRAWVRPVDVLLAEGASRIRVAADGSVVDAHLPPDAIGTRNLAVMQHIAMMIAVRAHGLFHFHAGAIRDPELGGMAFVGPSGAGKTSLTLAFMMARHGVAYLGDDSVLLAEQAGQPALLSYPGAFHVAERSLPLARGFQPTGETHSLGKHVLDPAGIFPGRALSMVPRVDVVLCPEVVAARETSAERLSAAEALGELLIGSALVMVAGIGQQIEHLALLRALAERVRAYRVQLGEDLLTEPRAAVDRIVETLRRDGVT
jgi:hypothetical protein